MVSGLAPGWVQGMPLPGWEFSNFSGRLSGYDAIYNLDGVPVYSSVLKKKSNFLR